MLAVKKITGLLIPGFPGYRVVSNENQLQVIGRYGPMDFEDIGGDTVTDYRIRLKRGEYERTVPVLDLVCRAYHGAPPSRNAVAVQINGDTSNYLPENIKWGTTAEIAEARRKWDSGEYSLTLEDRRRMWDMFRVERISYQSIASEFECDTGIVFRIVTEKRP